MNPLAPSRLERPSASRGVVAPTVLKASRRHFNSDEEFLFYLTHGINNTKQKNGRINSGYDESGNCIAISVSPYSKSFWDNVEPGIAGVVRALADKRYLTYSSCEGHCLFSRRFVGVAFVDNGTRDAFVAQFVHLKKYGIATRCLDQVNNERFEFDGPSQSVTKKRLNEDLAVSTTEDGRYVGSKEDEIKGFNVAFHRAYHEYYFCELIILDEAVWEKQKTWLARFKCMWLWFLKRVAWDWITQKVIKTINAPTFEKYRY